MAIAKVPARLNSANVLKVALHQAKDGEVLSHTASLTKQESLCNHYSLVCIQ